MICLKVVSWTISGKLMHAYLTSLMLLLFRKWTSASVLPHDGEICHQGSPYKEVLGGIWNHWNKTQPSPIFTATRKDILSFLLLLFVDHVLQFRCQFSGQHVHFYSALATLCGTAFTCNVCEGINPWKSILSIMLVPVRKRRNLMLLRRNFLTETSGM